MKSIHLFPAWAGRSTSFDCPGIRGEYQMAETSRSAWARIAAALTGFTLLALPGVVDAHAESAGHAMGGHFTGFYRSTDLPDHRGTVTFDVSVQQNRKLSGDVCGMIIDGCVPFDGTISESGQVAVIGRSPLVTSLVVRATAHTDNAQPGVLEGHFSVALASGARVKGDVVAVQQLSDSDSLDSTLYLKGKAKPGRADYLLIDATLAPGNAGAIAGSLRWHAPVFAGSVFDLAGQSFGGTGGGFVLVGATRDALVAITARQVRDATRRFSGNFWRLSVEKGGSPIKDVGPAEFWEEETNARGTPPADPKDFPPQDHVVTPLTYGASAPFSGPQGSRQYFSIDVALGSTSQISTASAVDVDAYIAVGAEPSTEAYLERAFTPSGNETLTYTATTPGTLYLMIDFYQGGSGVVVVHDLG